MGSRCYDCGEKFGRCAEHAGSPCPSGCGFGKHACLTYDPGPPNPQYVPQEWFDKLEATHAREDHDLVLPWLEDVD